MCPGSCASRFRFCSRSIARRPAAEAEQHLAELEASGKPIQCEPQVWRRNWARITRFSITPPISAAPSYTTNSVESLNRSLRKIIKTRADPPRRSGAEAVFLALRQRAKKWTMPISLAGSLEPLHDSVAGTDAGPGAGGVMKAQNPSAIAGRGRILPLPSAPIPKTKPGRLHRKLTYLWIAQNVP